jgi:hypothetical protein
MTNEADAAALIAAIDTALRAEHWTPANVRTPPSGMSATAWTGPDHTVHLMVTYAPDESITADLTGHPAGHPADAIWSLSITDPDEQSLLAATRAAAEARLREVVGFAHRLQRAGWTLAADDKPTGTLCRITSADGQCVVTRLNGTETEPGGWILDGDGLRADATDGTPVAVLAAMATAIRTVPEAGSAPGTSGLPPAVPAAEAPPSPGS